MLWGPFAATDIGALYKVDGIMKKDHSNYLTSPQIKRMNSNRQIPNTHQNWFPNRQSRLTLSSQKALKNSVKNQNYSRKLLAACCYPANYLGCINLFELISRILNLRG
ncbi:hypothetical protein ATANTOWER_005030 [Ataeniobius toweri]|uniref:Uncharacterized protein n=1 Tax=Ataeniobius toweri TaxID=208326 RepID=A0ABU7A521_9TELE|nr:hypothetical protein [Ataeniobius toweri]